MKCLKILVILAIGLWSFSSCKKDHPSAPVIPPPPGTPVIPLQVTSFAPLAAAMDSVITITGKSFSTTPNANLVTINNIPAIVVDATTDQLKVKVPKHAGIGVVHVKVGDQEASAPAIFQYLNTVTTLAGNGTIGFKDGTGNEAEFNSAYGLAMDGAGNLYVADAFNSRIRKVTPDGHVSTLAGDGTKAFKEGNGTAAEFNNPSGVAATSDGVVYVADAGNNRIRRIAPNGDVTTLAGDGFQGFKDGAGAQAEFKIPQGIALDASGNVYVADSYNSCIRKITPAGEVSTLAGKDTHGYQDGNSATARFGYPGALTVDAAGFTFVADGDNNSIRKIDPAGQTATLAGNGSQGFQDGVGPDARFISPTGVADGGHGYIYVTDFLNFRIRQISPTGIVATIAGSSTEGFKDGVGANAQFSNPTGIVIDASGTIYVMDAGNFRIRVLQ